MFKDIRSWRPIEWFSLLVVVAIVAGIGWGISSLGFMPILFVIAVVLGAAWFYKDGL